MNRRGSPSVVGLCKRAWRCKVCQARRRRDVHGGHSLIAPRWSRSGCGVHRDGCSRAHSARDALRPPCESARCSPRETLKFGGRASGFAECLQPPELRWRSEREPGVLADGSVAAAHVDASTAGSCSSTRSSTSNRSLLRPHMTCAMNIQLIRWLAPACCAGAGDMCQGLTRGRLVCSLKGCSSLRPAGEEAGGPSRSGRTCT